MDPLDLPGGPEPALPEEGLRLGASCFISAETGRQVRTVSLRNGLPAPVGTLLVKGERVDVRAVPDEARYFAACPNVQEIQGEAQVPLFRACRTWWGSRLLGLLWMVWWRQRVRVGRLP